jgi:hypothetical protein
VPYTIEDTLLDVQPHSLDDPFHWCPQVRHLTQAANISKLINPQRGTPVWVKVPESEDEDCKHRWRKGVIEDELFERQYTHMVRRPPHFCLPVRITEYRNYASSRAYSAPSS